MADISMCGGGHCHMKMDCYRHQAPPSNYWQAYFSHIPIDKDGKCDYFIPNKEQNENVRPES